MSEASKPSNYLKGLTVKVILSRRGANQKSLPKLNLGNKKKRDAEKSGALDFRLSPCTECSKLSLG